MAKLFSITAIQHNQYRFSPVSTLYLNPNNVISAPSVVYTNNSGALAIGTQIMYSAFGKTFPHTIIATEAPSTVLSRMAANPTTDVHSIALTIIDRSAPNTGYIAQTFKTATNVNIDDIWMVQAHPLNNSNAMVITQNQTRTVQNTLRTEQSASAINTAANA